MEPTTMATTTLNKKQEETLNTYLLGSEYQGKIAQVVARDALNADDPLQYLLEAVGADGNIDNMIYCVDTYAFFDEHYDEIEELRLEWEDDITGEPLKLSNTKNDLAWFGYEIVARNIADELETAAEEENNMRECESCGEQFDRTTEPKEVAEGGVYMCPKCWEEGSKN